MIFQIFLQLRNGFDLRGHSLLFFRFAMLEMSEMTSDSDNSDAAVRHLPDLILL